jgi:dCTP deaminase
MEFKFLNKEEIANLVREEKLIIDPLLWEKQFTTAGVDLRLDTIFREFVISERGMLDVSESLPEMEIYQLKERKVKREADALIIEPIVIHRNEFITAQTLEYICLPSFLVGFLDGRSSLARRGIIIHATAGSIEPGFRGHITLELGNIGKLPVKIYPLMRVANLHLAYIGDADEYKGQFWGQVRVKPPKPDNDLLRLLGRSAKEI